MAKQKQQVISRYFGRAEGGDSVTSPSKPTVTAIASFSPSKRKLLSSQLANYSPAKRAKPEDPPSLHERFVRKLLEPDRGCGISACGGSLKYTPLEQQFVDLKNKYPDVLLMVEVGYKYRFFGDDAEVAARVLGIYSHVDHSFLTASIPSFRLDVHLRRLVNAGFKVGVIKQTETAAIKAHGDNKSAPFTRELSAVYTKATLEAAEGVGDTADTCGGDSSYLCCVVEKESSPNDAVSRIGVVGVEISTGEVVYGEFDDGLLRNNLEAFLLRYSPVELVLRVPLSKPTEKLISSYAGSSSNVRVERFSNELGTFDEEDKLIQAPEFAKKAVELAYGYLRQFGLQRVIKLGDSFQCFTNNTEMNLSSNTLHQLEILRNNSDGSEMGSLLHLLNQTHTVYGARTLRHWVTHPLCDKNMILSRLDAVSEIADSASELHSFFTDLFVIMGRSRDLQRGITRIFHGTATPKEFTQVLQTVLHAGKRLSAIDDTVKSSLLKRLMSDASSSSVLRFSADVLASICTEAAEKDDYANLFIDDRFPDIENARHKISSINEDLNSLLVGYRTLMRMKTLDFISIAGDTHLLELPADVAAPSDWIKVNSTKRTVRYRPLDVLGKLEKLGLANEELKIICRNCWNEFVKRFADNYADFRCCVHALSVLDCLLSLATIARNKSYVRPRFVEDDDAVQIRVSAGRHPVLDALLGESFVPNETDLDGGLERCQIITGPNMGGKSCYIRQVALITLMAHMGSYVPAESASMHVVDNVYTRIGASDSIQRGRSTFLEETTEAGDILVRCTRRSLVVIDELGRGTSTRDGVAIAYAALHYLLEKKCLVLFVTHYPKLTDIIAEFPRAASAYHVAYLTSSSLTKDVTYLYKILPSVSDNSFGLKVAEMAQLPTRCIMRAAEVSVQCRIIENFGIVFAKLDSYMKCYGLPDPMLLEDARRLARQLLMK